MASLGVPISSASHLGSSSSSTSRKKVVLKPGYSLVNWIKLGNSKKDLTGTGGKLLQVTAEELRKHRRLDNCWTCIRGRVYNLSHYLEFHPGGVSELMRAAGIDATSLFMEIHNWVNEMKMLEKCVVGSLTHSPVFLTPSTLAPPALSDTKVDSLSPTVQRKAALLDISNDPCWQEVTIDSVVELTSDTRLFTFKLPKGAEMDVPVGYHIHLKVHLPNSQHLLRSYTPVDTLTGESLLSDKTKLSLLIKIYPKGPMSSYLKNCLPGRKVQISRAEGTFDFSDLKSANRLLLLATGTGITPMIRIVRLALETKSIQETRLVYGNKRPGSAIWIEEFNQLSSFFPTRFKLTHVLSDGEGADKIDHGFIERLFLSDYPDPSRGDIYVCVCGQTDFITSASDSLLKIKVPSDSIYTFW